jgi:hypothetical protein
MIRIVDLLKITCRIASALAALFPSPRTCYTPGMDVRLIIPARISRPA